MQFKYSQNPNNASSVQAVYLQNGQVSWLHGLGGHWHWTDNEPANLVDAAIANNVICGLDNQGHIHYFFPLGQPGWTQDTTASNVLALSGDDAGNLYATNNQGQVWVKNLQSLNNAWNLAWENIPVGAIQTWNYTVQSGDWLLKIVRQQYNTWGNDTLTMAIANQIKTLNPGVANWNTLKPGDVLKMPPK